MPKFNFGMIFYLKKQKNKRKTENIDTAKQFSLGHYRAFINKY